MEELEWSVTAHIHRFADGSVHWFVSFSDGDNPSHLYDEGQPETLARAVHDAELGVSGSFASLMRHRALGAWQRDRS